jgi:hypothetical protein
MSGNILLYYCTRPNSGTLYDPCSEILMVGMIMDTSVRCTPGESWPYNFSPIVDVLREPVVRAVQGYIYEIHPQWVPIFRRGTWLRRTAPDT